MALINRSLKLERSSLNWRLNRWQQAAFVLAFALVADSVGFSGMVKGGLSSVLAPLQKTWVSVLGVGYGAGRALMQLPKSAQRIQDLELRLAEASASFSELEALRRENDELRSLLGSTDRSLSQRVVLAAPVVAFARPAIAAGSAAGVESGAVVLSRNTLLGLVGEVSSHEAKVILLTDRSAPPIVAKTESGVEGLIVGDGRKLLFTQVAKEAVIRVGERVATVGQPQVEQGLPVGRIVSVVKDPAASVQTAVVEQYASFYEVPLVEVH